MAEATTSTSTSTSTASEATGEEPAEAAAPAPKAGGGIKLLLLGLLAVALVVGIAVVAAVSQGPDDIEIEVPAGTGAQLDAGEIVEVVPTILRVEPGATIEVDNQDSRLHVLGNLTVDAGDTEGLAFPNEGRYILPTSLRSDGQVTVLVEDPNADLD